MQRNPFLTNSTPPISEEKEQPRDPLDVRALLTNTSKAVITPSGELKVKSDGEVKSVELMKERYWG